MISSISSSEIISVVIPDPNLADAAAVHPNGTKTLLANDRCKHIFC